MKKLIYIVTLAAAATGAYWLLFKNQTCMVHRQQAQAENAKVLVVNVLDKDDYVDAHIKGSIHVPFEELEKAAAQWNKEVPVILYCSNYMCTASGEGAKLLSKLGFKDVRAYEGGMAEWYQLSKKDPSFVLEGPAKAEYLEIVIEKPAGEKEEIQIIDAQELQKLLKDANLL